MDRHQPRTSAKFTLGVLFKQSLQSRTTLQLGTISRSTKLYLREPFKNDAFVAKLLVKHHL